MFDALIDQIYEAAFVPELWPDVLDDLVAASDSASAAVLIFRQREAPPIYRTTAVTRESLDRFVSTDLWRRSGRAAALFNPLLAERIAQFLYVADYMTAEQLKTCSVEQSLRDRGLGEQLQTAIPMPSGEIVGFTFEKWVGEGRHSSAQIAAMNGLRPHLARAGLIAARLGLERAEAATSALQALGLPAAVLTSAGRVLAVNDMVEAQKGPLLPMAFGGVRIADARADGLFQAAVASINQPEAQAVVRSIPLRPTPERSAAVIHVLPLRRSAYDIFSGADILVVVSEMAMQGNIPPTRLLSALFDLTPSEARLAALLAAGRTLARAAAEMEIGFASARTYLARIFAKTGTNQQSQLIALLKSTAPMALSAHDR